MLDAMRERSLIAECNEREVYPYKVVQVGRVRALVSRPVFNHRRQRDTCPAAFPRAARAVTRFSFLIIVAKGILVLQLFQEPHAQL